jgi:hypothetical protein
MNITTNNPAKAPRAVLYGTSGIGKTTFAASLPAPVFICVEDGLGRLAVDHFPLVNSFDELMSHIVELYQDEHSYQTVVIDSLDWLERLIWQRVAQDQGKGSIEEIGYAKGYIFALEYWGKFLSGLDALREARGIMPILISHALIKKFNSPITDPYDRYQLKLHEKAEALIREWADLVLFATYKVTVRPADEKKKTAARGVGGTERIMYTTERPGWLAKNRYNLPDELPFDSNALFEAMTAP